MWTCQEVAAVVEEVRIQSSNISDMKQQLDAAENKTREIEARRRQCDDSTERISERVSAAEAQLERLAIERHAMLVNAVVATSYALLSVCCN